MIEIDRVSYRYPGAAAPALRDISLQIAEGEFLLVCGPSGAGKSSLLRLLNGLVPHFYGGQFSGAVRAWGRDTLQYQPRDMADLVGFVFQDPESQFVVDVVEDEIVFGMENLGLPPPIMRRRLEEVLDQLAIAHLRRRRVSALSGGERQRVAIAAALAAQPRALVLDEPTSQLDPHGAEEVLTALQKLNADMGITIVLCEHRLERVVQYADRVLYLGPQGAGGTGSRGDGERGRPGDDESATGLGTPSDALAPTAAALVLAPPQEALARIPLVPPLQDLARQLGWSPLPLTIKQGRAFAAAVGVGPAQAAPRAPALAERPTIARAEGLTVRYGEHEALYRLSLELRRGELLVLMGRNGSGKSSLLKCLCGLIRPQEGRVLLGGRDLARLAPEELAGQVGYVPQNPRSLLFRDTLEEELAFTLAASRARRRAAPAEDRGRAAATLAELGIAHLAGRYPRDLSGGEAQRAALAAIAVAGPELLLLDEPTRGLDYAAKAELAGLLRRLCAAGRTVVMATHDVELAASCADRVALLGDGELVVEGPAAELLSASLLLSPQVAKLFPGRGWLTVEDAMAGVADS